MASTALKGAASTEATAGGPPYVASPLDLHDGAAIGGKAEGLLALTQGGLPVPTWFVVLPSAFAASVAEAAAPTTAGGQGGATAGQIRALHLAPAVETEIRAAIAVLCPAGETVAVRSSAGAEDSAAHSYAGQFETCLSVAPDDVPGAILRIWESGFGARAAAYRERTDTTQQPTAPGVIVQRQLASESSGVAFSANPVSARRGETMIAAVRGQGEALVSGRANADTWVIARTGETLSAQPAVIPASERGGPVLDGAQLRAVAALAREAERLFGRPQDIEWAFEGGQLYILQSRPITTLAGTPDPDGVWAIWDCTNIAENYSGVTTPLTYSFASHVYEHVYRAFCADMGVTPARIDVAAPALRGLIGMIRGRLYYNLLSWYRVLDLLPGARWNRAFLDAMLGVRIALPDGNSAMLAQPSGTERLCDAFRLLRVGAGLLAGYSLLSRRVARFQQSIGELLATVEPEMLCDLRADQLASRYRALETRLEKQAGVATVNDFWVMVLHGILRRVAAAWGGPEADEACGELLALSGRTVAQEITESIGALAQVARQSEPLLAALAKAPYWQARQTMSLVPGFADAFARHISLYGDRVPGELKLETLTLHDDPQLLMRAIAALAAAAPEATPGRDRHDSAAACPSGLLREHPFRRALVFRLLAVTRTRLRDRENLRFTRARIFATARRLLIEMGKRLSALGVLAEARDVLWLEVNEILAFVEGRAGSAKLAGLAGLRKAEFRAYAAMPAPPSRFETRDIPFLEHAFAATRPEPQPGQSMTGLGCSPGVATGRVRVLDNPQAADLVESDIVVTRATDPGWVIFLPSCGGLLVETGNPLSHAAIVARELGVPMVAMLPEVTRWLRDGDRVVIDGRAGTVTRLSSIG
jgi:rifampicin phosphotransferase